MLSSLWTPSLVRWPNADCDAEAEGVANLEAGRAMFLAGAVAVVWLRTWLALPIPEVASLGGSSRLLVIGTLPIFATFGIAFTAFSSDAPPSSAASLSRRAAPKAGRSDGAFWELRLPFCFSSSSIYESAKSTSASDLTCSSSFSSISTWSTESTITSSARTLKSESF